MNPYQSMRSRVIDARLPDAKGLGVRNAQRDINGNIISGQDVSTGANVNFGRVSSRPTFSGLDYLKQLQARNRPKAAAPVAPAAMAKPAANLNPQGTAARPQGQPIPAGALVINDNPGRGVVTRAPAASTPIAQTQGMGRPGVPVTTFASRPPEDGNPHGMAYLNALAKEHLGQAAARVDGRASGAGYDTRMQGNDLAMANAERASRAAMAAAPAMPANAVRGLVSSYGSGYATRGGAASATAGVYDEAGKKVNPYRRLLAAR